MSLKPKTYKTFGKSVEILRDGKNVQYTTGNITLDTSKFTEVTEVPIGTAVFRNEDTDLFELVTGSTPASMKGAVLTANDTIVEPNGVGTVSAIRNASVIEARCKGITDNFKKATQGRLVFDI
ncbi:hypothetical protein [Staphylococcus nepalensis]|uniref:hypothetical protein n=1 Tax=Staphylococcus nepalensis TaxID=214473 RepID=UPI0031BB4E86